MNFLGIQKDHAKRLMSKEEQMLGLRINHFRKMCLNSKSCKIVNFSKKKRNA